MVRCYAGVLSVILLGLRTALPSPSPTPPAAGGHFFLEEFLVCSIGIIHVIHSGSYAMTFLKKKKKKTQKYSKALQE